MRKILDRPTFRITFILLAVVPAITVIVFALGPLVTADVAQADTTRESATQKPTHETTGKAGESTSGPAWEGANNKVQTIQGIVTTLGIIFGGLWAYAVFYHAGNNATAVQIELGLKQVINLVDDAGKVAGKGALVSVRLKNIGRVRVVQNPRTGCKIGTMLVTKEELVNWTATPPSNLAPPITNTLLATRSRWDLIFSTLKGMEPGEETAADVLLLLKEDTPTFKVTVQFNGLLGHGPIRRMLTQTGEGTKPRTWASRAIFDVRAFDEVTAPDTRTVSPAAMKMDSMMYDRTIDMLSET